MKSTEEQSLEEECAFCRDFTWLWSRDKANQNPRRAAEDATGAAGRPEGGEDQRL